MAQTPAPPAVSPSPAAEASAPVSSASPPEETSSPTHRGGLFHRRSSPSENPSKSSVSSPAPQATPTSPAFSSLNGVWEVQRQDSNITTYSHFRLTQTGTAITGTWLLNGKSSPLTGTCDGHTFNLVATSPSGDVTFTGYVLDGVNLVGLLIQTDATKNPKTAFTATHRVKVKELEGPVDPVLAKPK